MPELPPRGKVFLKQADITTMDTDAIVNSANNDLILGSDVSGAIRRLGGPKIQEECHAIGTVPLGEAVVTGAGGLPSRFIIHAAVVPLGLWADARWVRNGAKNAFKRAAERGVKSISFPAIGHGAGAFPLDRCAEILLDEAIQHFRTESTVEEVYFVLAEPKSFAAFEERLKELLPGVDLTPPPRAARAETAGEENPPPATVEPARP